MAVKRKKAAPKKRVAKKAAPKRRVAKKAAPKRKVAKKAAPKRKVAKKAAPKKRVAKKTTRKVAKKAAPKRKVAKKTVSKSKSIKKAFTKTEIMKHIAEEAELKRQDVSRVFELLGGVIDSHVRKGSVGQFNMPGLFKIVVKKKPATRARKGINPFTGEPTTFKAKPARNIIKIRPLKALKEMAQ